ncbi:hypothetical protein M422DRAFT_277422 [Sphaerobolus stellatus SS14]|uniref:Uncharacterized protein n=1 Tax=Sphaerobolus stellatus (strain SS14) TaxID=990650 RepID=A0A0C9TK29_SPHS4|nr:hypothetical protein M422DRAFT_277422 [Sphaerobolus stellatus SS14]
MLPSHTPTFASVTSEPRTLPLVALAAPAAAAPAAAVVALPLQLVQPLLPLSLSMVNAVVKGGLAPLPAPPALPARAQALTTANASKEIGEKLPLSPFPS